MQGTEDSWRSSLDFNLAHPEYRRDSSVSIVTELWAGQPRNNFFYVPSSCKRLSSSLRASRPAVRPKQPLIIGYWKLFPRGAKWQGSEVDHLPLVPRLRMTGAMLPHPCVPASKKLYRLSLAGYPPILGYECHIS
jgi:hypothetical protein